MSKYSIKNRFISSFIGNIARSGISFATALLLARWLGAEDYGRMAFLLASFVAFKQLVDMATTHAFFTFISRRTRSRKFVKYYWFWIVLQFFISLLIVGVLLPDELVSTVWEGESRLLVVLSFVAVFMQHVVWLNASRMAEAQRETIQVQKMNTFIVLVHFVVVVLMAAFGKLALPLLFVAVATEWFVAGIFAAKMYVGLSVNEEPVERDEDTPVSVFLEFWRYCMPFIPYAWLSFAHDFADRWMLQHWGGATEQAYFAIARQFSLVALLATSSILNILWKEIAESYHKGDMYSVEKLFIRASKGLYFIGLIVVGGILPWASEILLLMLGEEYIAGAFTLMIMLFYPLHQALGQVAGSTLLATGHNHIQVIMGIIFMVVSLVTSYFMLAPSDAEVPGLGLASNGLAWKMVVLQVVQVNIWLWVIARLFSWKFELSYQIVGLLIAVSLGWIVKSVAIGILGGALLFAIILSFIVFSFLMVSVMYSNPGLLGCSRLEIMEELKSLLSLFNARK